MADTDKMLKILQIVKDGTVMAIDEKGVDFGFFNDGFKHAIELPNLITELNTAGFKSEISVTGQKLTVLI